MGQNLMMVFSPKKPLCKDMQHRVAIANRREISKMVDNINTNL
jgi:hypothetical protein